jgi:hypothetical protein
MNKTTKALVGVGVLCLSAATLQAQNWGLFTDYTDVVVYQHYDNGTWDSDLGTWAVPPAPLGVNPGVNTWSSPATEFPPDRINAYPSDFTAAQEGGMRVQEGQAITYNGTIYRGQSDWTPNGMPDAWTRVGGGLLTPGATYTVAAYSVIGGSKDTAIFSLNAGATWTPIIDLASITPLLGGGADWLVHSDSDAIGTPGVKDGDTRFRVIIGDAVADASGNIVVGFRDPNERSTGGSSDRGRIDGYAVALGPVSQVPEPTTFALAGLGAAAMLIFRRRR